MVYLLVYFARFPVEMRRKAAAASSSATLTRPSLMDTILLTSTPLRRAAAVAPRSATKLAVPAVLQEKNATYEDLQLLNLTRKSRAHKSKRSRSRKAATSVDDEETENDEERKKPSSVKRKPTGRPKVPPPVKKLRQINQRKSSAGSSTVDEEAEETRLIEQTKLFLEGANYQKIKEHNAKIVEKLNRATLPSPILSRASEVLVVPVQSSSPVKIKTASRITFAVPIRSPTSPQMPPTTTAMSIETQTDEPSPLRLDRLTQTETRLGEDQSCQTENNAEHLVCRDLTRCVCVEQLVKTREFLVESRTKSATLPATLVLAKSSLKGEQQLIFDQFLSQFPVQYSATIDEQTTHLITDALDENTPLVCPLTLKVIQATARHLPIVSIQWLNASLTHRSLLPMQTYEVFLGDPTYGYHGGFLRSRIPRPHGLFHGLVFAVEQGSLLADPRALKELIALSGGSFVEEETPGSLLVLCQQIKRRERQVTAYVKPEWLLASIAQFNLQPFEHFTVRASF